MCFHSSLAFTPSRLARRYDRSYGLIKDFKPIYHASAFAFPVLPIVTDGPNLEPSRWGLIPFWVRDIEEASELRRRTFNARGETLFGKPAFRSLVAGGRCLIPSTGFFDWRHEGSRKIPYFIRAAGEDVFSLAGLHSRWQIPGTDETVDTFTMVTCPANRLMRYIHNTNYRMPVVLTREEEELWLDPSLTGQQIKAMMQPAPDGLLTAYRVHSGFMRLSPYDPAVLEPEDEPAANTSSRNLQTESSHGSQNGPETAELFADTVSDYKKER